MDIFDDERLKVYESLHHNLITESEAYDLLKDILEKQVDHFINDFELYYEHGGAQRRYIENLAKKQKEAEKQGNMKEAQKLSDQYMRYVNTSRYNAANSDAKADTSPVKIRLNDGEKDQDSFIKNDEYIDIQKNEELRKKHDKENVNTDGEYSDESHRENYALGKKSFLDDVRRRKLDRSSVKETKDSEDKKKKSFLKNPFNKKKDVDKDKKEKESSSEDEGRMIADTDGTSTSRFKTDLRDRGDTISYNSSGFKKFDSSIRSSMKTDGYEMVLKDLKKQYPKEFTKTQFIKVCKAIIDKETEKCDNPRKIPSYVYRISMCEDYITSYDFKEEKLTKPVKKKKFTSIKNPLKKKKEEENEYDDELIESAICENVFEYLYNSDFTGAKVAVYDFFNESIIDNSFGNAILEVIQEAEEDNVVHMQQKKNVAEVLNKNWRTEMSNKKYAKDKNGNYKNPEKAAKADMIYDYKSNIHKEGRTKTGQNYSYNSKILNISGVKETDIKMLDYMKKHLDDDPDNIRKYKKVFKMFCAKYNIKPDSSLYVNYNPDTNEMDLTIWETDKKLKHANDKSNKKELFVKHDASKYIMVHRSPVDNITELKPSRGSNLYIKQGKGGVSGQYHDAGRVYFILTTKKDMNMDVFNFGKGNHLYQLTSPISGFYIDGENTNSRALKHAMDESQCVGKAVYVKTDKPLKVKKIK